MPLLDSTYQEIAAWIEAADPKYAEQLKKVDSDASIGSGSLGYFAAQKAQSIAKKAGLFDAAVAAGGSALYDVYALSKLVGLGKVSPAEATAFLNEKYPNQKWSSAKWGAQGSSAAASTAAAIGGSTTGAQTIQALQSAALDVQKTVTQGTAYEPVPTPAVAAAVFIDPLPKTYSQDKVQAVIQSIVDQVSASLGDLSSKLQFGPGSIPGSAITPGTLPPSAFNPSKLIKYVSLLPGPEDAILIEIAPSQTMDRWVVGSTYRGPGRIWSVVGVTYPPNFKPKPGPTRYRVVTAGAKFTVMSVRLDPSNDYGVDGDPPFECRYGIVIEGLEHFLGRVPIGVWALSTGDSPVALASVLDKAGGGGTGFATDFFSNRLFHTRAKATYQDATFPSFTAIGSGSLAPSASDWQECEGFTVMLVSGTTDEEVYQQMNTLDCIGQSITREAPGPADSVPGGLVASPPATPSVYRWNGSSGLNADYHGLAETDDLSTYNRIAQGIPFRYEDCERLVATDTRFSVVIQPFFFKSVAMTGTWTTPDQWGNVGLATTGSGVREWFIDLLIW